MPTGRRDGRVSSKSEAQNLPSPLESIAVHKKKFAEKGLDEQDLLTLLGKQVFLSALLNQTLHLHYLFLTLNPNQKQYSISNQRIFLKEIKMERNVSLFNISFHPCYMHFQI